MTIMMVSRFSNCLIYILILILDLTQIVTNQKNNNNILNVFLIPFACNTHNLISTSFPLFYNSVLIPYEFKKFVPVIIFV